jgi:hypothetical protein
MSLRKLGPYDQPRCPKCATVAAILFAKHKEFDGDCMTRDISVFVWVSNYGESVVTDKVLKAYGLDKPINRRSKKQRIAEALLYTNITAAHRHAWQMGRTIPKVFR